MYTQEIIAIYCFALIICAIFFVIALAASQIIKYKPNHSDVGSRKAWFWICGVLTLLVSMCMLCLIDDTYSATEAKLCTINTIIASVAAAGVYVLIGWIVSRNTNGKLASWFN